MGAPQWKIRAVVVERGTTPAGSLVTARAVAAELAVMSILVAAIALAYGLVEWLVVHVAAFTGDGSMCPGKGKVREIVGEERRVETDDVAVAPLMVGVTAHAAKYVNSGLSAVKARTRRNIGGNAFVAVGAEPALSLPVQSDVAIATVRFQIGVTLDQISGHEQPLVEELCGL
jgi:hypothetical protein